jgi:PKD repeat protein
MVLHRGPAYSCHLPYMCMAAALVFAGLMGAAYSEAIADEGSGIFQSGGPLPTSVSLTWTAVGDDGSTGVATTYDIRYGTSILSEENWEYATQVSGEPDPQPAGQIETVSVNGLEPDTIYYFGLKVADEVPNWSGLSNVVTLTTLPMPPVADFEGDGTSGASPLTVSFSDLSTNNPTLWHWTFGDGATSAARNPTHVYSEAGTYTVSLAVSNAGGGDTLSVANYIDVYQECLANCDIDIIGTRTETFQATHVSDNFYETIEEVTSHKFERNAFSCLEHKWMVNILPGNQFMLQLEAHHSSNVEGDDFIFSFSADDIDYTDLLIVTKTIDDDTIQSAPLPSLIQGTVYIRVIDTDGSSGNLNNDQLFIDKMFVISTAVPDTTVPVISNLLVQEVTSSSAVISWNTNEPSTSVVRYDSDGGPNYDYSIANTELAMAHNVELSDLSPATEYYFVAEATDCADNVAYSSEYGFVTTRRKKEIVIADLEMEVRMSGAFSQGVAKLVVATGEGIPIEGAEIFTHWSGFTTGAVQAFSKRDGSVNLKSDKVTGAGGWFVITIDDIRKDGLTYNPDAGAFTSDSVFVEPGLFQSQPESDLVDVVTLRGCYPNPGVNGTNIHFELPEACRATLKIFDITGRPVHTLIDSRLQSAGRHQVVWDRRDAGAVRLSNGVYFIQLTAGGTTVKTRLALLD